MLSSQRYKKFIKLIDLKNILIIKDELKEIKKKIENDNLKLD